MRCGVDLAVCACPKTPHRPRQLNNDPKTSEPPAGISVGRATLVEPAGGGRGGRGQGAGSANPVGLKLGHGRQSITRLSMIKRGLNIENSRARNHEAIPTKADGRGRHAFVCRAEVVPVKQPGRCCPSPRAIPVKDPNPASPSSPHLPHLHHLHPTTCASRSSKNETMGHERFELSTFGLLIPVFYTGSYVL